MNVKTATILAFRPSKSRGLAKNPGFAFSFLLKAGENVRNMDEPCSKEMQRLIRRYKDNLPALEHSRLHTRDARIKVFLLT